ncbi:unnamed protein product [Sphenostylis stenocarpa]|uniref:Sororin C-terminal region domain-containing protein n=1 Tax=Sphenostylis stenocarpa TaxID=92480 RepID=A0AA86RVY3_9FABA|nr:unnamed protein product [Sphenostylis stenocarpa]
MKPLKKHAVSCEEDVFKDAQLQDYIEKQNAYFKEVDEYELPEEELQVLLVEYVSREDRKLDKVM